jgi:general secretion pathway protein G
VVSKRKRSVFFPWERRPSALGLVGRARTRGFAVGVLVVLALLFVWRRERRASEVRATRAAVYDARRAVLAWRADHDGGCPPSLDELARAGYVRRPQRDAWGRPLRLECPDRADRNGFRIMSDGPDGVPGGLDRVE